LRLGVMIQSGSHNRRQSRPGALAGIGCTMSLRGRLMLRQRIRGAEDRFLIASVLAEFLVVLILLSKPQGATIRWANCPARGKSGNSTPIPASTSSRHLAGDY
jgi:hypothetical protein